MAASRNKRPLGGESASQPWRIGSPESGMWQDLMGISTHADRGAFLSAVPASNEIMDRERHRPRTRLLFTIRGRIVREASDSRDLYLIRKPYVVDTGEWTLAVAPSQGTCANFSDFEGIGCLGDPFDLSEAQRETSAKSFRRPNADSTPYRSCDTNRSSRSRRRKGVPRSGTHSFQKLHVAGHQLDASESRVRIDLLLLAISSAT